MSAPQKTAGGKKTKRGLKVAPSASSGARGSASPKAKPAARLPKPPQGHGGYARKRGPYRPPRRDGQAPRYTNRNAKEQMLDAALKVASERGYEAMRVSDITDPIGVTRQAFYAHFRDKRHCVAEALDPKLGAIERMAASASEQNAEWAPRVAHLIDDVIADRFGSPEGTRGRIVNAMIELLGS